MTHALNEMTMTAGVDINPKLLQWACVRSGRQPEDLYARFQGLPAWLAGESRPTLKQVERFARATYTPVGYLFLSKPPSVRLPIADLRTLGSKALAEPSADLLETIYLCQQRQAWYHDYARGEGETPLALVGAAKPSDDVVQAASAIAQSLGLNADVRSRYGSWSDALRDLIIRVERAGVLVMTSGIVGTHTKRKLKVEEFRGFALADDLAPLIFINGADSKAAQMFTLAHELAHIWLGASALSDLRPGASPASSVETWCNKVAAELLVPLHELAQVARALDEPLPEVKRLAKRFKVSTLVVLRRLSDASLLDKATMWRLYQQEVGRLLQASQRPGGGGNFYLTQRARLGQRFASAVVASTLAGRTLYLDAFRLTGCRKLESFQGLSDVVGAR